MFPESCRIASLISEVDCNLSDDDIPIKSVLMYTALIRMFFQLNVIACQANTAILLNEQSRCEREKSGMKRAKWSVDRSYLLLPRLTHWPHPGVFNDGRWLRKVWARFLCGENLPLYTDAPIICICTLRMSPASYHNQMSFFNMN